MSMSPTKEFLSSPYMPYQMKKVLDDALSPANLTNSPLGYKSRFSTKNSELWYSTETSSEHDGENEYSHANAHGKENAVWCTNSNENTPLITVRGSHTPPSISLSTPVRPLYTPSPSRNDQSGPAQTYEVEASFLQAMVGLLERQANLVPDYVLTKSDIQSIVRKEMQKQQDVRRESPRKALSGFITPSYILGLAAGAAGLVVYQRASLKHPEEVSWYIDGAWKGGLIGLAGAAVIKGVLWGLDTLRRG